MKKKRETEVSLDVDCKIKYKRYFLSANHIKKYSNF